MAIQGYDSVLSLPRAWIQSWSRTEWSSQPCGMANKEKIMVSLASKVLFSRQVLALSRQLTRSYLLTGADSPSGQRESLVWLRAVSTGFLLWPIVPESWVWGGILHRACSSGPRS